MKAWWHRNRWPALFVSGLATLFLGLWGFIIEFTIRGTSGSIPDAFYRAIQLFWIRSGSDFYNPIPQIEIARYAAVVIVTIATIEIFATVFNEQYRLFRLRTGTSLSNVLREHYPGYHPKPGHVVICGAGFLGSAIACHFRNEGREVVVLEKDEKKADVKTCRENGALVLHHDATDPDVLRSVRVGDAAMVFVLTGDNSRNTDIASTCAELARERPAGLAPLACHVHIEDPNLSFALRQWEYELPEHELVHFGFFNLYHATGRVAAAIVSNAMAQEPADEPAHPILLIVGLGDFGKSLLINLVKRWRETWFRVEGKLTIIVVDKDAKDRVDSLASYYPSLSEYCEILPKNVDVHSGPFVGGDFLDTINPKRLAGAYVCLRDEGDATSVAITLHTMLCNKYQWPGVGPITPWIIVRTVDERGMTQVVRKLSDTLDWNIVPFPVLTNFCEEKRYGNELFELLAEATHQDYVKREEAEKQRQIAAGVDPATLKSNPSNVPWSELPEDVKDTNRAQAKVLIRNIHEWGYRVIPMFRWDEEYLHFDPGDPMVDDLAKKEHFRYVEMKTAQGYRWGPENDKENKINRTLIPWDDPRLSKEEKEKDIQTVLELPDRLASVFLKLEYRSSLDKKR